MNRTTAIVVMGVAGCGKSSVGQALAHALDWPLIEGDDHHSAENKALMAAGQALTDAHRADWLHRLADELAMRPHGAVLTCSALKKRYRDLLRTQTPALRFVFLDIPFAVAQQRVAARASQHFFSAALVQSQFDTLERPDGEVGVARLDATQPLHELSQQALRFARASEPLDAAQGGKSSEGRAA
jgi:gluconokinase